MAPVKPLTSSCVPLFRSCMKGHLGLNHSAQNSDSGSGSGYDSDDRNFIYVPLKRGSGSTLQGATPRRNSSPFHNVDPDTLSVNNVSNAKIDPERKDRDGLADNNDDVYCDAHSRGPDRILGYPEKEEDEGRRSNEEREIEGEAAEDQASTQQEELNQKKKVTWNDALGKDLFTFYEYDQSESSDIDESEEEEEEENDQCETEEEYRQIPICVIH